MNGGWWAIDVAAYSLSRLDAGLLPLLPLDPEECWQWVRQGSPPWMAGVTDPSAEIPWRQLNEAADDLELVWSILRTAAGEALVTDGMGFKLRNEDVGLAARHRLLPSTLRLFGDQARGDAAAFGDEGLLNGGYADNHIHQAAALPLDSVIHWIAASVHSLGRLDEVGVAHSRWEAHGVPFRPEPLLALVRSAQPGAAFPADARDAFLAATGDVDAWRRVQRSLPAAPAEVAIPTLDEIVRWKQDLLVQDPAGLLALLRAEAVLHATLLQRRAGLDEFIAHFDRLRQARQAMGVQPSKELFFQRAVAVYQSHCPAVVGLELRLGEIALTGANDDGHRALRADLLAALRGYSAYLQNGEDWLVLSLPLGLIRTDARPSENWRFNLRDMFLLTEALIELLDSTPELLCFVDGIDVCGREDDAPSWVFAPVFRRLAAWARSEGHQIDLRCHAGEWPWNPVNGLRAIVDFLQVNGPGVRHMRVGHGLALASSDWTRVAAQPVVEFLEDLCWTWAMVGEDFPDAKRRLIGVTASGLARRYFPSVTAGSQDMDLLDAFSMMQRLRLHIEPLRRVGVIEQDSLGRLSFKDGTPSPSNALADRLLCELLRPDVASIGTTAGEALGDQLPAVVGLLQDAYVSLSEQVMGGHFGRFIVEACPTSNLFIGAIRGYEEHPAARLAKAQVPFTINTDDPSLFHAFLDDEIRHMSPVLGPGVIGDALSLSRDVARSDRPRAEVLAKLEALLANM